MSIYTVNNNITRRITDIFEKKDNVLYKKNTIAKKVNNVTRKIYLCKGAIL